MASSRRLLYACFLLSGCAGLVYEVAWVKMLRLLFGSTVLAVSTILAVYFAGLSLGSLLFGKRADRPGSRPVRLYAILEIAVAITCIASPLLLSLLRQVYASLVRDADPGFLTSALLKLALAFCALIVPTTLLGGTLPLGVAALARAARDPGAVLARLYGINTLGAVAGTLLAGFALLPVLGVRATLFLAALADLVVGIGALVLSRRLDGPSGAGDEATRVERATRPLPEPPTDPSTGAGPERLSPGLSPGWALALTGTAGFTALGLEILLTRAIVILTGSTVYAFSLILAVFLLGIGLGSHLLSLTGERLRAAPWLPGALLALTAVLAAATGFLYVELPALRNASIQSWGYGFSTDLLLVAGFAALLLLPLTILFGALFPLCVRHAGTGTFRLGSRVGLVYAVNTLAGILGSVVVGFFLVPWIGVFATLGLLAGVNGVVGVLAFLAPRRSTGRLAFAGALLLTLALAALLRPEWNPRGLTNDISLASNEDGAPVARVLYHHDGVDATVSVLEEDGLKKLYVNGTIQASSDVQNLRLYDLLAHLPMLLARGDESVLVIGLGSGVTAGTAAFHGPSRLTCVEISSEVPVAARYFSRENRDVLDRDNLHLVIDDARSHIFASTRKYDVITANAFLPSNAGTGALYSVEHFRACRDRLEEGGVLCQWVPLFALSPDDLRTVIGSFLAAFPEATLWFHGGYALLLGSPGRFSIDLAVVDERFRRLSDRDGARLRETRILDADQILGLCLLGPAELASLAAGASLNTDDHPIIEYSAPRHIDYRKTLPPNIECLLAAAPQEPVLLSLLGGGTIPADRERALRLRVEATLLRAAYHRARAREDQQGALAALEKARSLGVPDPFADEELAASLALVAQAEATAGSLESATRKLLRAVELDATPAHRHTLGLVLAASGRAAEAVAVLDDLVKDEPSDVEARVLLATLLYNGGDAARARKELAEALRISPDHVGARVRLASVHLNEGETARALDLLREATRLDPGNEEARTLLHAVEEATIGR